MGIFKKILFFMFLLIVCLPFVYSVNVSDSTGFNMDGGSVVLTTRHGFVFETLKPIMILSANQFGAGANGTNVQLFNRTCGLIGNCTFSGDNCSFVNASNYAGIQLQPNTNYSVMISANGRAYKIFYDLTVSFPVVATNIKYYLENYGATDAHCFLNNDTTLAHGITTIVSNDVVTNYTTAVPVVINGINVTDRRWNVLNYKTQLNESSVNYFLLNATKDSNCSFYQVNVTDWFGNVDSGNYSLSSNFELQFNDSNENMTNERWTVRLCSPVAPSKNVDVYINNVLYRTISAGLVPSCAGGLFYEETNITASTWTGYNQTNISLRCPTCSPNNMRMIAFNSEGGNFLWTRLHRESGHPFPAFDTTINLYNYSNHLHTYSSKGSYSAKITCNTTFTNVTFIVGDIFPVSAINEIISDGVEQLLTNGSSHEIVTNTTILGDCSNENIVFRQMNVSYGRNGTLVKTTNDETIYLGKNDFGDLGQYNVTLYCRDDEGNFTSSMKYFVFNDTIMPMVLAFNPLNNDVYYYSEGDVVRIPINITAYDVNLYSLKITINYSNGTNLFTYLKTPTSQPTETFLQQIEFPPINQIYTFYKKITDAHTNEEIPIYDIDKSVLAKEITISDMETNFAYDVKLVSDQQPTDIQVSKLTDRYTWTYRFDTLETKNEKDYRFRIGEKKDLTRVYRSEYPCHFVIGKPEPTHWVDYSMKNCKNAIYSVSEDENAYFCDITTSCTILDFNSFGEVNTLESTTLFQVYMAGSVGTLQDTFSTVNMSCQYNPTPQIRAGFDNKIEWSCNMNKTNVSEDYDCITELYDAHNTTYLIQVNPSYDDFKSKTTLIGGGNEIQNVNKFFTESKGQVIVYFDGGIFDYIKPKRAITGRVVCRGDQQTAVFVGNMTPDYIDYTEDAFDKVGLGISNANLIAMLIVGIMVLGIILTVVLFTWKRGVFS